MDVLGIENPFARRSTRTFTPEPVKPAEIEMLLEVAMAAPSAVNRKPWHFIVVTDAGLRQALAACEIRGLTRAGSGTIPHS